MPLSTFDKNTTPNEVITTYGDNIRGKTVLISGCSKGGIGIEVCKSLLSAKPGLLIITGRNEEKLKETEEILKQGAPDANIRTFFMDLGSLSSVRKGAELVNAYSEPIDVLIHNAAIPVVPYKKTEDGHESQFAIGYLAPFLFTNLIKPRLAAAKEPRIVVTSSEGHSWSDVKWDDPTFNNGATYEKWEGYGQTKTAAMLFAIGLAKRWKSINATAFSLHPGRVWTALAEASCDETLDAHIRSLNAPGINSYKDLGWQSVETGSATTVLLAADPSIKDLSGAYFQDCQVATGDVAAKPYAASEENADRLWKLTEEILGQKFE